MSQNKLFSCRFKEATVLRGRDDPSYLANLGVLYHRWGKTEEAAETYSRVLELDPKHKSAAENLKRLRL